MTMILEGRKWHQVAKENGRPLRGDMQRGKVYLYQIYTTIFVEFDTVEAAEDFRKYLDSTLPYWDYDPVATLDTNKAKTAEKWSEFIVEGEGQCQNTISDVDFQVYSPEQSKGLASGKIKVTAQTKLSGQYCSTC